MSRLDYAAIRRRIPIRCVLLLLDYEPVSRHVDQWRGPCPLPQCSSSVQLPLDRNFSVNVTRHLFRCFRCGSSGNQLDLWGYHTGLPLYAATLDLCRRLLITPVILSTSQPPNRN